MKEFSNIIEAINYHQNCYVCGRRLNAYFEGDPIKIGSKMEVNLSSGMDSDYDDILTIDVKSGAVSLEMKRRYSPDQYYINSDGHTQPLSVRSPTGGYKGTLYQGLHMDCPKCHQFGYVIQMVLDIEKIRRISHLYLNSEFISWEDDKGNTHEINNAYSVSKTWYNFIAGKKIYKTELHSLLGKSRNMDIPLIPLNLRNPSETLARIKTLITFS